MHYYRLWKILQNENNHADYQSLSINLFDVVNQSALCIDASRRISLQFEIINTDDTLSTSQCFVENPIVKKAIMLGLLKHCGHTK